MEFIPETLEALGELDPMLDETVLSEQLAGTARRAQDIAPGLVGISVASITEGLTFTLVATDDEIAALDAVQYLDHGPCVDALHDGRGVATTDGGLLAEERWHQLAVASASAGIRSTLTIPVLHDGEVVGTVNLYGASEDTFYGRHEAIAEAVGAWAPGAISNADLTFSTIEQARLAPGRLRDDAAVDTATGILAADRGLAVQEARDQLQDAATRAGVPLTRLARVIIDLHEHDG